MAFKRKLIFEDKAKEARMAQAVKSQLIPRAESVRDSYLALGIGEFNADVFDGIVREGIEFADAQAVRAAEQQLKNSGITLQAIRKQIINDVQETVYKSDIGKKIEHLLSGYLFEDDIVRRQGIQLDVSLIKYQDGRFLVKEEGLEVLFESRLRVYLESEEEDEVYGRLEVLADAFNTVRRDCSKFNYPAPGDMNPSLFETNPDGTIAVSKWAADNLVNFARRREEHENARLQRLKRQSDMQKERWQKLLHGDKAPTQEDTARPEAEVSQPDNIIV